MTDATPAQITEALKGMDAAVDDQWTSDGLPKVDAVEFLLEKVAGANLKVTRAQITGAAPTFNREVAAQPDPNQEDEANANEADQSEGQEGQQLPPEQGSSEDGEEPEVGDGNNEDEDEDEDEEGSEPEPQLEEGLPKVDAELEALQAELAAAEEVEREAAQMYEAAKADMEAASDNVNAINRKIEAKHRDDPNLKTAGIRDYLNQSQRNREDRAAARQRFFDSLGASPQDLAENTAAASPLDQALSARRNPRRPMKG